MRCSDPLTETLADYGYCAVRWPRAHLYPLDVLERDARTSVRTFGHLSRHLPATGGGVGLPEVSFGARLADLSSQRTSRLRLDFALDLLGAFVTAMGGNPLGLGLAFGRANALTFELAEVHEDSVAPGDLDLYLKEVATPPGERARELADGGRLYVVIAALRCRSITVYAHGEASTELSLSLPDLQAVASADMSVGVESESTARFSYEGRDALAFGFKALQIYRRDGTYTTRNYAEGSLKALAEDEAPRSQLVVPDALLELSPAVAR